VTRGTPEFAEDPADAKIRSASVVEGDEQ